VLTEDQADYDVSWQLPYPANVTTNVKKNSTWAKIREAFTYRSASDLSSLPYDAKYSQYLGGGYVFAITPTQNVSKIQQQLTTLQSLSWIDRQTRAVLVEFTLYNVNVNLFAYCTLAFEFLPTGSIVTSNTYKPVTLFTSTTGFSLLATACNIIYIVMISFSVLREVRSCIKIGLKKYFTQFWAYAEWLLIIFSFVSLAMYMYRMYEQNNLFATMLSNTNPNKAQEAVRLQKISYWTDTLITFISMCSFIGMLKFTKMIRFSRNIVN
jgi:hypothetical protein